MKREKKYLLIDGKVYTNVKCTKCKDGCQLCNGTGFILAEVDETEFKHTCEED